MLKFMFMMMMMLMINKSTKKLMIMMVVMMLMFISLYKNIIYINIGNMLGVDSIASILILMSMLIIYLMFMSSSFVWEEKMSVEMYLLIISMMNLMLFLIFSSMNIFMFFVWFELILIPMFLLIMGWGSQSERFNASMYMMFYTIFGSLPLIMGLVFLYDKQSMNFLMLKNSNIGMWSIILYLAFLIKLPMYFFHYWLPKAHVEAPVTGSMILAGVLLKLGSYGIFRFYQLIGKSFLNNYIISISMIGGIYTSFLCLRQVDAKSLIAYSSVGHMGLLLGSFLSGGEMGYDGGVIMMVGHGLCSSGMFCLMNILYERMHSRSLVIMRGFLISNPSMLFWMFLIMSSNMSAPPSLNLISEIMLLGNLMVYSKTMMLLMFIMFMMACAYSLFLFSIIQHDNSWSINKMGSMNLREMLLMLMHWVPLNMIFMVI